MTASPTAEPGTMMPDSRAARDADFAAYLAARQPSLMRTAYLLTGNRHDAEDLVQTAFAKLYLSWDKVRNHGSIDGYVRRILVNEHNSLWRRAWKRREHSQEHPVLDRPVHDVFGFVTDPTRLSSWQTNTVSVTQEGDGPLGLGTRLGGRRRHLVLGARHGRVGCADAGLGADDRRDEFAGGSLALRKASHGHRPSTRSPPLLSAGRPLASAG